MTAPFKKNGFVQTQGFTLLELLIVIAMVSVITGFAIIQIVRARQNLTRINAAQQLAAYLEKARLDSVRRHPSLAQMAQVSIVNANFYTVTIDSDGNGALDAPRVFNLPAGSNLQFNGPYPRTIYFDGRGRTVDSSGVLLPTPAFVTISNNYGSSKIDLTTAGQPSLDGPPASSTVTNSATPAATPKFRENTQIP
jgi:prepilin-type N-terminal cleavage/methylation domain-containing protein